MLNRNYILVVLLWCVVLIAPQTYALEIDGYVSDSAGMLSPAEEQLMEETLRKYEQQTSAEIAVVTVDSTHGKDILAWAKQIGNEWGVGKADADNGVVIAIALDDRKFAIAPGLGVEFFLPKEKIDSMLERNLPGAFKEQDSARGINNLLIDLTEAVGHGTPEERLAIIQAFKTRAKEDERKRQERVSLFGKVLAGIIAWVIFVVSAFFGIRKVRKNISEKKRKQELTTQVEQEISQVTEKVSLYRDKASRINDSSSLPEWITESYDARRGQLDQYLDSAESLKKEAASLVQSDPDEANEVITQATHDLSQVQKCLDGIDSTDSQITAFQQEALTTVNESEDLLKTATRRIEDLINEGFHFEGRKLALSELAVEVRENADDAQSRMSGDKGDKSDAVGHIAQIATAQLASMLKELNETVADRNFIIREIADMKETTASIAAHDTALQEKVQYLRENAVPLLWQKDADDLEELKSQAQELVGNKLSEAESKVDMQVQDFAAARSAVESARSHLNGIQELRSILDHTYEDFESARGVCSKKLRAAETRVQDALEVITDSDVKDSTSKEVKLLSAELDDVRDLIINGSQDGLFDWSVYKEKLGDIISNTQTNTKKARREISAAQKKRRQARQSRQAAYSSSSYKSPSSPGPSSNDTFGGGSFGGGGSSGSW